MNRLLSIRSLLSLLFAAALVVAALAVVRPASAQNKAAETAARGLQKKAMEEDYLVTEFDKARDKLADAIKKCENKCGPPLRAELRRDMGVVLIGGQLNKEKGAEFFVEALKLDGSLQLNPDVKTKELEEAFEKARARATGGAGAPKGGGGNEGPQGDFVHTAVAEQLVRTPVPIYAEYQGPEKVVKVVAKYKGFGMPDWKTVELKKLGTGYGALVPCSDVQQGDFLYYLQGFNSESDPVATSGDRNNPFRLPIKRDVLAGEPPHLPDQAAPKQCAETTDCPPNFPGCKKAPVVKPEKKKPEEEETEELLSDGEECEEDGDCKGGKCDAGKCTTPAKTFKKFWVGVSGSIDLLFVSSAENVCKLGVDPEPLIKSGYYCTKDGSDYPDGPTTNGAIELNKLNTISGGTAPGNMRVNLTFDYALNPNILVGGRLGFVTGTYPGTRAGDQGATFAPVHIEARGTYLLGKEALAKEGFAPMGFAALGVSQFDAKLDVNVVQTGATPAKQTVEAWTISGPIFIALGGGARYAVSTRAAITGALKLTAAMGPGGFLPAVSPEFGAQFGF